MKRPKETIGKQEVVPFFCPMCREQSGESQVGRDIFCPPKHHKETSLCYRCGYSRSEYMLTKKK